MSSLDKTLNTEFSKAKSTFTDKRQLAELKSSQLLWLKDRDSCLKSNNVKIQLRICLEKSMLTRISFLNGLANTPAAKEPISSQSTAYAGADTRGRSEEEQNFERQMRLLRTQAREAVERCANSTSACTQADRQLVDKFMSEIPQSVKRARAQCAKGNCNEDFLTIIRVFDSEE